MSTPFVSRLLDIPTEILLSIFTETSIIGLRSDISSKNLCLSGQYSDAKPILPDPLNIASVCSRWRTIALNTPELWSSFSLSLDSKQFASPTTLQWLRLYVLRSKEAGLTIRVHGWYYDDHPHSQEVKFFMTALSSCIHRWRELDITSASLPQGWDSMAKSFFQLLDATTCCHHSDGTEVQSRPHSNLRSFTINEPPYLPTKLRPSPHTTERGHLEDYFQHLTSLTIISRLYLHRLWYCGILHRCSSKLTDLTIELLGVPDSGQYYRWNVLPCLRTLTIVIKWPRGNPLEALASIFSALVCPGLKKLEVRIETELPCVAKRTQWPGTEIVDFLSVRLPEESKYTDECNGNKIGGLEEIVLVNVVITAQELEDLFQAAPGSKISVLCQQTCHAK